MKLTTATQLQLIQFSQKTKNDEVHTTQGILKWYFLLAVEDVVTQEALITTLCFPFINFFHTTGLLPINTTYTYIATIIQLA